MTTNQPTWKLVANLGDVNPIDYGGYFVYVDETGKYDSEAELLVEPEEDYFGDDEADPRKWMVYRFSLEDFTYENGVLSDNEFHKDHSVWFAQSPAEQVKRPQDTTKLANVASFVGQTEEELRNGFLSKDPVERAWAYKAVGDYHGFENFDSYPLILTRAEVEARYKDEEVQA